MTENSRKVFEFLRKNKNKELTKYEIVEELDIPMSAVTGSVNNLVKKGYAEERQEVLMPMHPGQKPTVVRWVQITEEGMKYDPDEEERQLIRERQEAQALRRAKKLAEREERARQNAVL